MRGADSTTPNEFGHALSRVLPGTESAVHSITTAYYVEQFDPESSTAESLSAARNGCRRAVVRGVPESNPRASIATASRVPRCSVKNTPNGRF